MASVTILDCTLRDGSYVVRQQFSADDTARICAALEAGGVREIEIGPGVGLGAAGANRGKASDEEYLSAAADTLHAAQFGMFYIPGIGDTALLDMACAHGMHFVRVGTNAHQYRTAQPHIEHARKIGLKVSYNAMKSYLLSPAKLLLAMQEVVKCGAEAVYVVDSAGTLVPAEVKAYVHALAGELNVPIGFHGHNNLMLANANCLAAWEEGATLFDGTLQGIGRSGGNAQTETLAWTFEKMNVPTGLDVRRLLEAGERLVRPLMGTDGGGATALNVIMGMAGFHSTYLERVDAAAARFNVDVKDLILAVSELDRVDPSPALIEQTAAELMRRSKQRVNSPTMA